MRLGWRIEDRFVLKDVPCVKEDEFFRLELTIPYYTDENNPLHIKTLTAILVFREGEVPKGTILDEKEDSYYVTFDNQSTFDEQFPEFAGQIAGYPILKEKIIKVNN